MSKNKIDIADHRDYKYFAEIWQSIDDILMGISHIMACDNRLNKYYPAYVGGSKNLRKLYIEYIKFNPAASESLDTMLGMVLRVSPRIEGIEGHILESYLEKLTWQGLGFTELVKLVLSEVIAKGRIGLYSEIVDKKRPYCFPYTAQNITNWVDDGIDLIDRKFVLREEKNIIDPEDKFGIALKTICQKRLIGMTQHGFRAELYQEIEDEWIKDTEINEFPNYMGKPFDYLPFLIIGSDYNSFSPSNPPLERLVNLIIQYNRHDSDMSFSAAQTDCPIPFLKGAWEGIDGKSTIEWGSGHLLHAMTTEADAGYLAPQQSVNTEKILQRLHDRITASAGKFLSSPRPGIETAEAIRLRSAGDTAKLTGIVSCCAEGLTQLIRIMARQTGDSEEQANTLTVVLNTDFIDTKIDMADVSALGAEVEAGRVSWATYFYNNQEGELYKPDWTEDMEREAIERDQEKKPSLAGLVGGLKPLKQEPKPENNEEIEPDTE